MKEKMEDLVKGQVTETSKLEISNSVKVLKSKEPKAKKHQYRFTATELLEREDRPVPYLWEPFIGPQEVVALAGSSDLGKSSLLRQLAIHIALKKTDFLGHPLHVKHGRAIYYATEDGDLAVERMLKKQLAEVSTSDVGELIYLFPSDESPLKVIEEELALSGTDAVFIDCLSDVFSGPINDVINVKAYLKKYKDLARKYDCVFFFLHHNCKKTEFGNPNKNNMVGSQAIEGTMRVAMELRKGDNNKRLLWFTKGNYLPDNLKKEGMELEFDDNQEFTFTGKNVAGKIGSGRNNKFDDIKEKIIDKAIVHRAAGLTIAQTLVELNKVYGEATPSQGTLHAWMKERESKAKADDGVKLKDVVVPSVLDSTSDLPLE